MGQTTTFLQLCKDVRQECGLQGTGPASVTSSIGDEKRIVDWVRNAWLHIQRLRQDWKFMRQEFEFETSAGEMTYPFASTTGLTALGDIDRELVSAYKNSDGQAHEYLLSEIEYTDWRRIYNVGVPTQRKPGCYCVEGKNFLLGPPPDDTYTIRGLGRLAVQQLSGNTEVVRLDDEYIPAIKWLAVKMFAGFEEAGNIYTHADTEYNAVITRLEMEQLPEFHNYVEPLA